MNILLFSRRGRSERRRKKFIIPGLKLLLRLLDVFFGTYSWQFATPAVAASGQQALDSKQLIASGFEKSLQAGQRAAVQVVKGCKVSQYRRFRRRWSAGIDVSELLIRICRRLIQWREQMVLRGPPWALFPALDAVRLQE